MVIAKMILIVKIFGD